MLSLLKMILVFVFLLALLWRRVGIGYALLACALAVGVAFWLPPRTIFKGFLEGIFSYGTFIFMMMLVMMSIFGRVLKEVEALDKMSYAVERLTGQTRSLMAFVPAFIGLLPMPGGALLSAQMVDDAGNRLELSPERKMVLNYWFRHLWEPVFPMYPGIVLIAALFGVEITKLIWTFMPISVASILVGFTFYYRTLPRGRGADEASNGLTAKHVATLLSGTWPVLVIAAVCLSLRFFRRGTTGTGLDVLVVSLVIMVALMVVLHRLHPRVLWREFWSRQTLELVSLTLGIMVFQRLVNSAGAAADISEFMGAADVPVPLIVFFIPFLAGLMTGNSPAFVTMTFLLLGSYLYPGGIHYANMLLGFAGGFAGVLLSPVHLCFSLTKDFYGASIGPIYRMMAVPMLIVCSVAALFALGSRFLGAA